MASQLQPIPLGSQKNNVITCSFQLALRVVVPAPTPIALGGYELPVNAATDVLSEESVGGGKPIIFHHPMGFPKQSAYVAWRTNSLVSPSFICGFSGAKRVRPSHE
jgi:hypothetical protein